jgi:multidrug efflux pump subunit AcrB
MRSFVKFFTQRSLLVNLVSIGILIAGVMFLVTANREAFPRVEFDYVIITTIYPGATAQDIEKHISIPIENKMREVDGIEEVSSSSVESRSVVALQLDPDLENKDTVITDIRNAVDRVSDMPEDAEDPEVVELKSTLMPVVEVSVALKGGVENEEDERLLRKEARKLEDSMLMVKGVARIDKQGYRDREMQVEVDPRKLEEYHVGVNDVIMALKNRNLNFPAGLVESGKEEIMIRTIGEVQTPEEIEKVLIQANDLGYWVRVGDVARVKNTFEEMEVLNKHTGKQAVTLTIMKKESADIIDVVDRITELTDTFRSESGGRFEYMISNDQSYYVRRRLNVLINNGLVGILLVSLSLFLTLGWRISLVTVIGIPIAFAGTFVWMGQADVTVNLMSLFGLILVLGMVVDDAIIVAENVYRRLEEGEPPNEAVINGTSEVILPVLGTIMTTIAAFAPLMFMSGVMGKFMWTLPAVVSIALIASWVESMFILPAHINDIEKRRKKPLKKPENNGKPRGIFRNIQARYMRMLRYVLTHKYIFFGLITTIFLGSVFFAVMQIEFILFPQDKIERFIIKMEAPMGLNMESMHNRVKKFEKLVQQLPEKELESYITQVGLVRESPMDPDEKRGSNYAYIMVDLTPEEDRKRKASRIIIDMRKKAEKLGIIEENFENVEITTQRSGPPTGKPVSVLIKGEDFEHLQKVADEYKEYLHTIDGLKDIKDNYEEGKDELRIFVDEKTAEIAGISVYDVATTVRTCFKGTVATEIKKSEEEIDIRVIYPERLRDNVNSVNEIHVTNKMGNLVPLKRIARFERDVGVASINRQDWKRAIRVSAEIREGSKDVSSVEVNRKLMKKFANINERYPDVMIDYSGEFEDTQESLQDLARAFVIALLVIYIILVGLFRSLHHPLIIISIIPLTIIGVIWTFFFHGMVFSFLAVMGIVGLAGVIVNDSIVLVDFIKNNRGRGMNPLEASIDAGSKRIRPVFLTTITTFLGLIPTAYGIGGYDPFLKPMAVSMSWGLLFGTLVTLFATPLLYNIFSDIRRALVGRDRSPVEFIPPKEKTETEKRLEEVCEQVDDLEERIVDSVEKRMTEKYSLRKKASKKKGE